MVFMIYLGPGRALRWHPASSPCRPVPASTHASSFLLLLTLSWFLFRFKCIPFGSKLSSSELIPYPCMRAGYFPAISLVAAATPAACAFASFASANIAPLLVASAICCIAVSFALAIAASLAARASSSVAHSGLELRLRCRWLRLRCEWSRITNGI